MRTDRNKNGSFRALIVILVLLLAEAIFGHSSARRSPIDELFIGDKPKLGQPIEPALRSKKPDK